MNMKRWLSLLLVLALLAGSLALVGAAGDTSPLGTEFRVNNVTQGDVYYSSTAMDADGDSVMVWLGNDENYNSGLQVRLFDKTGEPKGRNSPSANKQANHASRT